MIVDGLDKTRLLVVGVSGGADSLALLGMLHEAGFSPVVCHFNHRLRAEAGADASFVESVAKTMALPFEGGSGDVGAYAVENHLSVEEAARKLRYRFLFSQARSHGAQAVAVAHTADDQVETVLMHFVRGAGLSGLKGMLPRTLLSEFDPDLPLVRPILNLWRADTVAYCREHGLEFRTDPTNVDPAYFRNRLRLNLIPELETYNAGFKAALLRSSQALQGDHQLLNGLVEEAWQGSSAEEGRGFVRFNRAALERLPLPLRRGLIRRAAFSLRPGLRDVDFDALVRAADLPPTPVDIAGGLRLFGEAEHVYLAAPNAELPSGGWPQVSGDRSQVWEWQSSGSIELAEGMIMEGEIQEVPAASANSDQSTRHDARNGAAERRASVRLSADLAGERLLIRTPRPGDRLEPKGMPGKTVKLSDLFINHKIPRRLRSRWPLVCAGEEIAWVPGLRASERFQPRESLPGRAWVITLKRADRRV
jgi:tRNA(Ile)-lysidine synthase